MRIVDLDQNEWTQLLETTSSSTVFHTNEWLTVLQRTYRCEIQRMGFAEGSHLVGGIPVTIRKKFIYRIAGSPVSGMMTAYQGPIFKDPIQSVEACEAFWHHATSMGWDFLEVTLPPDGPLVDWRVNDAKVRCKSQQTIYLDLTQGEVKLFQEMDPDCRNAIRQSEKRGAQLKEMDTTDQKSWIDGYYDLSAELYRRQGRPSPHPKVFFENLVDVLADKGKIKVLLATYEDEMIAGAIFLVHGERLYFCDGVSKSAYNYLRPSNLIQWTIIRWACTQGLRTYDMLGANIPGIARFKKGFGGCLVPYVTLQRSRDWMASLGEHGYRMLAPLARRVAVRLGQ